MNPLWSAPLMSLSILAQQTVHAATADGNAWWEGALNSLATSGTITGGTAFAIVIGLLLRGTLWTRNAVATVIAESDKARAAEKEAHDQVLAELRTQITRLEKEVDTWKGNAADERQRADAVQSLLTSEVAPALRAAKAAAAAIATAPPSHPGG